MAKFKINQAGMDKLEREVREKLSGGSRSRRMDQKLMRFRA
jgi:hypothetical protein